MILYFKPLILFIIFSIFSGNAFSSSTLFIIYRDFGQKGDENQARGVLRAVTNHINDVKVEEFNIGKETELQTFIQDQSKKYQLKPILLAVGEKTVVPFSQITPLEGVITMHVSHMMTTEHKNLLGKINFIVLPEHVLELSGHDLSKTSEGLSTKLISTVGVPHNRQIDVIEDAYKRENARIPHKKAYLGVILAGDAPTPEGMVKLFKKSNAQELARYVAHHLEGRHLLIINGPRTGKFKVLSSENIPVYSKDNIEELQMAHRDNQLDSVTQAFLEELQKEGVVENQRTLFDFQFSSVQNQDMDLFLGALRATQSQVLVPGESTSAISETIDVLPKNRVTVYHTTAMNNAHVAHIKSELNSGRITYIQEGFQAGSQGELLQKEAEFPKNISAAETIARVLGTDLRKGLTSMS